MKKVCKALFLSLALFFWGVSQAKAANEFSRRQSITYTIDSRGKAAVEQNIWLTNKMSTIYPKEFIISLTASISSLSAWDESGSILVSQKKTGQTTKIKLKFNKKNVGKGQTLAFHLRYNITDFARKKGQVWEISLPHPKNANSFENYQASVLVPLSFNNLAYASVPPAKIISQGDKNKLIFKKENFTQGPIIIAFANFQVFDFSLHYFLENNQYARALMKIPLPPETNYQEVSFSQITPAPQKITIDADGNWLAEYILDKGDSVAITATGQTKVFSHPKPKPFYNRQDKLPLFLKGARYWPNGNKKITAIARREKTVKGIYRYVVKTLDYDYQRANSVPRRMGALGAISFPHQAVCTEFTDLFIALARASGIPAREIEGYANSNDAKIKPTGLATEKTNRTILHAWPEYWDRGKKIWVQVDPTWEKTTGGVDYFSSLDLNHFALVIHGESDRQPPPPGSYGRDESQPEVDIKVADNFVPSPKPKPIFTLNLKLETKPGRFFFNQNKKIDIFVKNKSLAIIKGAKITISSGKKNKKTIMAKTLLIIPPFGERKLAVPLPPLSKIIFSDLSVQIHVDGADYPLKAGLTGKEKLLILRPYLLIALLAIIAASAAAVAGIKIKNRFKN